MAFAGCSKDNDKDTGEVRLVEQNILMCRANGDTVTFATQNYFWEGGLLRRDVGTMYMNGQTFDLGEGTFVYDADGNCVEYDFVSPNLETCQRFTYRDGRMTGGVEIRGTDTLCRATVSTTYYTYSDGTTGRE